MQLRCYTAFIIISVSFCEFFGDYLVLSYCKWPSIPTESEIETGYQPLHVMIIADTHLLGPIRGHWLDKIYREWHMERAFQTGVSLHKPDVVFVLGDLFDEGYIVDHGYFEKYVRRFHRIFRTPPSIPIVSAVGNHDIGFHYKMNNYLVGRYEAVLNNTGVEMYTFRGNHFVFINSMAMQGDNCEFCEIAKSELQKVANELNCMREPKKCKKTKVEDGIKKYSRPVVLQHFPTYRESDNSCKEHDSPIIEEYTENWDVLSKKSTDLLGKLLNPRLSFAGHTHHYCSSENRWGVEEYTVASFSWRNKPNPSFLMVTLSPNSHKVLKCNMLEQKLVYKVYYVFSIAFILLLVWDCVMYTRKVLFKIRTAKQE